MPIRPAFIAIALASAITVALFAAPTASATTTVVPLPFYPTAFSNSNVVIGRAGAVYNRYAKGDTMQLQFPGDLNPAGLIAVNDSGRVIASFTTKDSAGTTSYWSYPNATSPPTELAVGFITAMDDDGRFITASKGAAVSTVMYTRSDGLTTGQLAIGEYLRDSATDGSFVTSAGINSTWWAPTNAGGVRLPDDVLVPTGVGGKGNVAGTLPSNGPSENPAATTYGAPVLLNMSPAGVLSRTTYPLPRNLQIREIDVNGGGRIVATGLDWSSPAATSAGPSLWTRRPGQGWDDISAKVSNGSLARLVGVNEWGDILVQVNTLNPDGTGGPGNYNAAGALITERVALTGMIAASNVSSGRSRTARGGRAVARTVTLDNGTSTIVTNAGRTGAFSMSVPVGSWTLRASAGSCLVTAGGCVTSGQVTTSSKVSKVTLAKLQVPGDAAFTTKANARLRAKSGLVKVGVRCAAKVACKISVKLKIGKLVAGSKVLVVKAGKSGVATIALSLKAQAKLTAKGVAATASLSTKLPGQPAASVTLPVKLFT